jgi:hypothetical protein
MTVQAPSASHLWSIHMKYKLTPRCSTVITSGFENLDIIPETLTRLSAFPVQKRRRGAVHRLREQCRAEELCGGVGSSDRHGSTLVAIAENAGEEGAKAASFEVLKAFEGASFGKRTGLELAAGGKTVRSLAGGGSGAHGGEGREEREEGEEGRSGEHLDLDALGM